MPLRFKCSRSGGEMGGGPKKKKIQPRKSVARLGNEHIRGFCEDAGKAINLAREFGGWKEKTHL